MSRDKILPNCVGRLDPVVEAIREGDRIKAVRLLEDEVVRRIEKEQSLRRELESELEKRYSVQRVLAIADSDFSELEDQWLQLRRECGTGTIGVEMQVGTLVYDAPEGLMETPDFISDMVTAIAETEVKKTDKAITGLSRYPLFEPKDMANEMLSVIEGFLQAYDQYDARDFKSAVGGMRAIVKAIKGDG